MSFEGKNNKYFLIITALIVIAVNAVVIIVYFQENSPESSFSPYSNRCVDLPVVPDQYYSIFNPGHLLMEQFSDMPMQKALRFYTPPQIPVRYNLSDDSFVVDEIFDDEYSFDYYLNNTGENLTVYYSPDVVLNGNNLTFDILILNRGNVDIEINTVAVDYHFAQLNTNGPCMAEKKMSGYDPGTFIHPGEFSEIRIEALLFSPDEVEKPGVCGYFGEQIQYFERVGVEVMKNGSPYPYYTHMEFEINPVF